MRFAIIPARGGSKRIPRKNIREFCGKPMIAWSIDAARRAEWFDHIVVSTDDEEIAEVARKELSDDIKRGAGGILYKCGWTAARLLQHEQHGIDNRTRGGTVADAPARHGVRFGQAIDDHAAIPNLAAERRRGNMGAPIVGDGFVNLI